MSPPGGYATQSAPGTAATGRPWYESFQDPKLSGLINQAFSQNLDVVQALARLDQASAAARVSRAGLFPAVGIEGASRKSWEDGDPVQGTSEIGGALDWEIDIFGRIRAGAAADRYEALAAADAVETVRLSLSADMAETYYNAIGQRLKLARLNEQIDNDTQLRDLTDLRFEQGLGTQVEVLQQESQLAETQSLVPAVEADIRVYENTLDVLTGQAPDAADRTTQDDGGVFDTTLPAIGVPSDLLLNRPDLRAMKNELIAADADIAAAIADRLPRITLSGSLLYADGPVAGPVGALLGGLVQPLLDWGRRRAEVERNEGLYLERLAAFSQAYLEAVADVENTLYREQKQREFIGRLERREAVLRDSLAKSEAVYKEGLSDYLPVLNAVNSLRQVERDLIDQRLALTLLRIRLYRALGGAIPSYTQTPSTYSQAGN